MAAPLFLQDGTGLLANVPGVGDIANHGPNVPADGLVGYAPACIFQCFTGTPGNMLYVNQGTLQSCKFVAFA